MRKRIQQRQREKSPEVLETRGRSRLLGEMGKRLGALGAAVSEIHARSVISEGKKRIWSGAGGTNCRKTWGQGTFLAGRRDRRLGEDNRRAKKKVVGGRVPHINGGSQRRKFLASQGEDWPCQLATIQDEECFPVAEDVQERPGSLWQGKWES